MIEAKYSRTPNPHKKEYSGGRALQLCGGGGSERESKKRFQLQMKHRMNM
jgi:hypothetical protein